MFAWIIHYYHHRTQRINLVEKSMIIANHFWEKYNWFIRSWPLLLFCNTFTLLIFLLIVILRLVLFFSFRFCGSGWWWFFFVVGDHQNNTRCFFLLILYVVEYLIAHLIYQIILPLICSSLGLRVRTIFGWRFVKTPHC